MKEKTVATMRSVFVGTAASSGALLVSAASTGEKKRRTLR
jgi:ATP-dependent protease ClpP protease subunit